MIAINTINAAEIATATMIDDAISPEVGAVDVGDGDVDVGEAVEVGLGVFVWVGLDVGLGSTLDVGVAVMDGEEVGEDVGDGVGDGADDCHVPVQL